MFRRVHLLWLTVPFAACLGYRAASPPPAPPRPAVETPPAPPSLPLPEAVAAIDSGLEKANHAELCRRYLALARADDADRDRALSFLCARWAEVDPAGALNFLATQPGDNAAARHALLTEWALLDPDAAWKYLDDRGSAGAADLAAVTGRLLHEDPAVFFQWYRRHPVDIYFLPGDPALLAVARANFGEFEALAGKRISDTPLAADRTDTEGNKLFGILAAVLVEKDPKAAFEWAGSLPDRVKLGALGEALRTLGKTDAPAAAAQLARLSHDQPKLAEDLMRYSEGDQGPSLLKTIGREDPALILDLLRKDPALDRESCLVDLFGEAVAAGRTDALTAYRRLSAGSAEAGVGMKTLELMWGHLSAGQLAEAGRSIAAEPDSKARLAAMKGIVYALFDRDPAAALGFAAGVSDPAARQELYAGLLWNRSNFLRSTPARQAEILKQIPASDRAAAFATLSANFNDRYPEPEKFVPLLADLPPSADLTRAVTSMALSWGQSDPRAAMDWVATLPDPDARAAGLTSALRGWALHDSYGASTWLSAQAPGKLRDTASLALIGQLEQTEPASAWKWASALSDPALRQTTCTTAFGYWAQNDPAAAAQALDDAVGTLPDAQLAELRKTLPAL